MNNVHINAKVPENMVSTGTRGTSSTLPPTSITIAGFAINYVILDMVVSAWLILARGASIWVLR